MFGAWNRWLSVCVVSLVALNPAVHAAQPAAGEKKGDEKSPKSITGKTIFNVSDALTDKDDFDPVAKDCHARSYKIKLQKGKTYQIDMISLDGKQFDTFLRLEDAKGKQVAEDDDSGGDLNARIVYTPDESGEFKIWATTFAAKATGKYKLTVIEGAGDKAVGKGGPPAKATPIKLQPEKPTTVETELTKDDPKDDKGKHFKVYSVELKAGNEYLIHMKGNAQLDAFVRLEDENGKLIAEDQDAPPNESVVKHKAEKTANYRIVATTYKGGMTGNFTLTVSLQTGKSVEVGKDGKITFQKGQPTVVKSEITKDDPKDKNGKHFKAFTFQAEAGKSYRFEMTPLPLPGKDTLDPEIHIEDAAGKEVKREDFGDGRVSRISAFSPAATGTFKLVAGTFKAGMTGGFTITASEETGAAPGKAPLLDIVAGKPTVVQDKLTNTDPKDAGGKHFKAYGFKAQPGKTYHFELIGKGTFDPEVRIDDEKGVTVQKENFFGKDNVSRIDNFTVTAAGTFRLVVAAFKGGTTGEYTLTAREGPGGAKVVGGKAPKIQAMPVFQMIIIAQLVSRLDGEDGTDKDGRAFKVFTFQTEPDRMYRIEMTGRTFDAQLRLEDEKGVHVKGEDAFDGRYSTLTVPAGKKQKFRIIASAVSANQFGTFSLSITEAVQKAAKVEEIAFERVSKITGKLTSDDGVDDKGKYFKVYSIKTQAGLTYRCEMTGIDPYLRLEDSKGNKVKDEDFGDGKTSRLEFAGQAGSMRLIATTFKAGVTGDFVLTIAERDKAPAPQALDIKNGKAVVNGSLADSDDTLASGKNYKEFTFKGEAGKTYKIDLHSKAFDAYLYLKNSAGQTLEENDDNGESLDSRIVYTVQANATYHIVATVLNKGTGPFTLTVAEIKLKAPEKIGLKLDKGGSGTASGKLTDQDGTTAQGKFAKLYVFDAEKDKAYRVEVKGSGSTPVDPYVRVDDANGKLIKQEEFGDGKTSRLTFKALEGGAHHIVVSTFKAGATGEYTLAVSRIEVKEAKVIPLELGKKGSATIQDQLNDKDATETQGKFYKAYGLKAEKGKAYKVEMQGKGGLDPLLRIENSQGQSIKEEDFGDTKVSRLTFMPMDSGAYRIIATTFKAGMTGDFTITIAEDAGKKDFDKKFEDKKFEDKKFEDKKLPIDKKGFSDTITKPVGKPFPFADGKSSVDGTLGKDSPKDKQDRPFKAFAFKAEAGKSYTFAMFGKDGLDPFIRIEDEKGQLVKEEDFGDGKMSRVTFKAMNAGTYRAVASVFKAGVGGGFTLSATVAEFKQAKVTALKFDAGKATAAGTLTDDDGVSEQLKFYQAYTFQAEKGKAYRFELNRGESTPSIDPEVRIEDEKGLNVRNEDFGDGKVSRLTFMPTQSGIYRAIVTTFPKGQTGSFALSATIVAIKAAKPVALTLTKNKGSAEGTLADEDAVLPGGKHYHEYTFTAEAGQTYRIDLHSKAFDAYLILKNSAGKVLAENDDAPGGGTLDSRIVWKAEKAETLHVLATTLINGRTGPYVLSVGEPDAGDKLAARVDKLVDASAAERKALVADLQKHFAELGKLGPAQCGMAMRVAKDLEETDKPLAVQAYREFGKLFAASTDFSVARNGKLMVGAAKRLGLVGQPMPLKGTTLDGETFDLAKMKGKVVLVDFWASWCGPCKAEMPNMKKFYEKHRKDGFEIIGISLDSAKVELTNFLKKEPLPWPSIFEGGNDLADEYGVFSIPLAILVGSDGRVVSLDARGAELGRLLEEELGKK